ncbi:sterol desaturase family protein [Nitrincola alkalisediminis]|uniref:sterol desaturase family protein n=1 Tax=Nitrincola alkalisediminis TaxID=1366656 RepID=UPI0018755B2C|nr:sterol desaturase family protein [Nitrincola alkalisediminis]
MGDEAVWRLSIFLGVLVLVAGWEWARPKRAWRESRRLRWGINLGLIGLNVLIQRLTLGAAAVVMAVHVQNEGWGLLNLIELPYGLKFVLGLLLLDLAIYLQHVLSHALPAFWRLHQVHHADLDLDVTTGLRFHPLEILISLLYKVAIIAALGIDPLTVLVFEALLNAASMFSHANLRMSAKVDQIVRWFVITPDMHRIHHSIHRDETDSNFGFFLSCWDRLFGTYRAQPRDGHDNMVLGLEYYQQQQKLGLKNLLLLPFRPFPSTRGQALKPTSTDASQGKTTE